MSSSFRFVFPLVLGAVVVTPLISIQAQVVTSPVVGFVSQDLDPDTDTVFTVGFHQEPAFTGVLAGNPVAGAADSFSLSFASSPGADGSFADSSYVHVLDGADAGRILPIIANAGTSVTVDSEQALGLADGDQVSIISWWTLASLFDPDNIPAEQKSSGDLPPGRQLEVLLFEPAQGTNLSPSRVFYVTDTGWKESVKDFPSADDVVIGPDSVLVFRTKPGGQSWKLITTGRVNFSESAIILDTDVVNYQDNVVGLDRPVPVTVAELGLESVFVQSASTSANDRQDELLIFDNAQTAKNRSPSATYFRTGGQWVEDTTGFPQADSSVIPAEAAIIVRKAPSTGASVLWVNQANYQ